MLIIGLTGGIGSGKTAVSDYLGSLGITIVDADVVSRIVVEPGKPALKEIEAHFGPEAIQADGSLDRAKLRTIVFEDPAERKVLEKITHARIGEEILQQLNNSSSPYTVLVSPILFESGQSNMTSRNLVVDVPEEIQQARTASRDGVTEESVKNIIKAQMNREERLSLADDVIVNDSDLESLHAKALDMHNNYLEIAKDHA